MSEVTRQTSVKTSVKTSCYRNRIHCNIKKDYYSVKIECGCEEDFTYSNNNKVVESLHLPEHKDDYNSNIYFYNTIIDKISVSSTFSLIGYRFFRSNDSTKFSIDNSTERGTNLINKLLERDVYSQAK